jgi:diketogulonate reductase-like aldo/keto reductase
VNLYDVVRRPPRRQVTPFFEVPASNGTLVQVPKLIYATAHKRHRTAELVTKAFQAGFRGVDTAHGERKRYNESAVGEALVDGVFVQLKVHYTPGEDAGRRCYAAARRGLDELRLHRVGALLLRGPSEEARQTGKLTDDDVGAWRALQRLVTEGRADLVGVCNFPPSLLEELLRLDGPRCSLHQTRLRADRAFNGEDRTLAERHGVVLQAPGLVTTNAPALRRSSALSALAAKRGATPERTLLAFALRLGVVAVVGSASPKHVLDDLRAVELAASLSSAEVDSVLAAHPDRHKPDSRRGMRRGPKNRKRGRSSLRGGGD